MRLPNADQAFVEDRKITTYLLSRSHRYGAAKCAFFESFGFRQDDWRRLRDALLQHAADNQVVSTLDTPFGRVFEVNGRLASPDGRNPFVLVVWFFRPGENRPRLVTAVPSRGQRP